MCVTWCRDYYLTVGHCVGSMVTATIESYCQTCYICTSVCVHNHCVHVRVCVQLCYNLKSCQEELLHMQSCIHAYEVYIVRL